MIITPKNRYGFTQSLTLLLWPIIKKLFWGKLKKYKGINVKKLGRAIALNISTVRTKYEELTWNDFIHIDQQIK